MGKRPLAMLAGGFVLGEVLGLRQITAIEIFFIAAAAAGVYAALAAGEEGGFGPAAACGRRIGRNWSASRDLVFLLLFVLLGFARGSREQHCWEREQALGLDGLKVSCDGKVRKLKDKGEQWEILVKLENVEAAKNASDEPAEKDNYALRFLLAYVDKAEVYMEGSGSLQYLRPHLGQPVRMKGELEAFDQARVPGQFDYRNYYRAQKLSYRMNEAACALADSEYNRFADWIWRLGQSIGQILDAVADPGDAGIYRAVLLGDKTGLDPGLRKLYQENGIAHLLAISGLHLSFISLAAYGFLRRLGLGFGRAGLVGGLFLLSYGMMAGASPSVVRAMVMALSGYLAAYLGRTYDLLSALSLAGILILWDSPYQMTQGGVQLSFAAVFGIAVVGRQFCQLFQSETRVGNEDDEISDKGVFAWARGAVSASVDVFLSSLGLQLMTLPVVLWHFFEVPLYGIFLNLLVVPLMGIVLASGTAGAALGAVDLELGRFAAGSGHAVLALYEMLCRFWGNLPYANIVAGRPGVWQIGIYYGALAVFLMKRKETGQKGGFTALAKNAAAVFAMLAFLLYSPPVFGMRADFLDVGQGDGICLRTKSVTVLVDGGSTSRKKLGEERLEPYFKSQGITEIDYAIVSHGDQDHISGLRELMQPGNGIQIAHLILPAAGKGDEVYEELEKEAVAQGGRAVWFLAGDELKSGKFKAECIYPGENQDAAGQSLPASAEEEDRNAHSLVIRVSYGGLHMLLTGDMGEAQEEALLQKEQEGGALSDIQVLKVAHHGSAYSSSEGWMDRVHPKWAVISYGEGNRYGHPAARVTEGLKARGAVLYETARAGTITLKTDGKHINWEVFSGNQ